MCDVVPVQLGERTYSPTYYGTILSYYYFIDAVQILGKQILTLIIQIFSPKNIFPTRVHLIYFIGQKHLYNAQHLPKCQMRIYLCALLRAQVLIHLQ